jgi:hypothetical protein
MRQGLAAMVNDLSKPGRRITVPVKLHLASSTEQADTVTKQVALLGPGDVLGINERVIGKTEPEHQSRTFEPSLIPFIEFTDPDFIWSFSTGKSADGKYWLPWLSLIVLRANGNGDAAEFTYRSAAEPELPQRIQLSEDAILPDLNFSWKWAHIHINDLGNKTPAQVQEAISRNPEQAVCRLLCPRRLEPQTNYTAFVIPTYRIGADAAMGVMSAVHRTELRWETPADARGRVIPFYYQWDFQTDTRGDFEYLVRLLEPRVLTDLGARRIDCSNPGYNLVQDQLEMQMEGALRSLDTKFQQWGMDDGPNHPNPIQVGLADLMNRREVTVNGETKLRVTPPVYGEWYTGGETGNTQLEPGKISWLEELNLDFRHRASAGLGVRFVKENQESLMKAAWKQYSEISKVNKSLNLGRFGREVSLRMYRRLETMPAERMLQMSLPLQSKIRSAEQAGDNGTVFTLKARLEDSEISNNLANVKVKKYLTKTGTIQSKSTGYTFAPLLKDQLVSPAFRPNGLMTRASDAGQIMYKIQETGDTGDSTFQQMGLNVREALDPRTSIVNRFTGRIGKLREWEQKQKEKAERDGDRIRSRALNEGAQDPLRPVMWYPEFHRAMYRFLRDLSQEYILPGLESIPENTVGLLKTNRRFLEAFMIGLNHEFASELRWREFPTDLRGSYFRKFWDTSIYSADQQEKIQFRGSSIAQELFAQIQAQYGSQFNTWEKIEATYTNGDPEVEEQQVAQAYEAAIENWLLTREEEKDIERPSTWARTSRLGSHPIQLPSSNKYAVDQLVVLIRGDLLRKYSNTLIYLVQKDGSTPPSPNYAPSAPRIFPVFEGSLLPDITFLGFPIGEAVAGNYFIVFEERMSDLRYGLDETDETDPVELGNMTLDNLSWQHFENLEAGAYLDDRMPLIAAANWDKPAFIARAFLQKQVRVAIELSALLPPQS